MMDSSQEIFLSMTAFSAAVLHVASGAKIEEYSDNIESSARRFTTALNTTPQTQLEGREDLHILFAENIHTLLNNPNAMLHLGIKIFEISPLNIDTELIATIFRKGVDEVGPTNPLVESITRDNIEEINGIAMYIRDFCKYRDEKLVQK